VLVPLASEVINHTSLPQGLNWHYSPCLPCVWVEGGFGSQSAALRWFEERRWGAGAPALTERPVWVAASNNGNGEDWARVGRLSKVRFSPFRIAR
jgi:hypothetical protein